MAAMASRKPRLKPKDTDSTFWAKAASRKLESHVPGVTIQDKGNLRPKVKGGRVTEVKAAVPFVQPETGIERDHDGGEEDEEFSDSKIGTSAAASEHDSFVSPQNDLIQVYLVTSVQKILKVTRSILDTDVSTVTTFCGSQKVSLRDLCVEDKKRVANLIKELAKLGEEKESAERNLEDERRRYEEQILQLVDQQEEILREREEVQKRMLEYQTYILSLKQHQKEAELKKIQRAATKAKIPQMTTEKQGVSAKARDLQHTPQAGGDNIVSVETNGEEGNPCDKDVEQPSKHFYLNDLDDDESIDNRSGNVTATRLDNLSTRVQPALSPQPIPLTSTAGRDRKNLNVELGQSPRPDRPFTSLIDRELENQKKILEVAVNNSANRQAHELRGGKSVQDLFKDPPDKQQEDICKNGNSPTSGGVDTRRPARPPRPSLPSHLQTAAPCKMKTDDGDSDVVCDLQKRGKPGNRGETSDLPQPDPRFIDFPRGNLSLLTPEKNELLSRFMQSHGEARHLAVHPSHRGSPEHVEPLERLRDDKVYHEQERTGYNNRDEKVTKQSKLKASDSCEDQFLDNDQENIIPERDVWDQKVSTKAATQQRHNTNKGHNHQRRKQRRPPPPSYGPLHPPVMSSTQKSSEFADFVSVASTDASAPDHHRNVKTPWESSPKDVDRSKRGHEVNMKNGKVPGKAVEFLENVHSDDRMMVVSREDDFLEKYRKMSPSERKRELLKQKSMLLEEQARLKLILADQETQLQQKQEEAMSKMEQFQEMRAADDREAEEMQASLLRLEQDLARKEQEVIQGRALLRQKKQRQVELQSEADEAFLEDKSPSKSEGQSNVLSSTPLKDMQTFPVTSRATEGDGQRIVSEANPSASLSPPTSPKTERKLSGRDGDGCVLYQSLPAGQVGTGAWGRGDIKTSRDGASETEAGIVRRLNFPPDSENEGEGPAKKRQSELQPAGRNEEDEQWRLHNGEQNEEKVDVGTSISYAHLPRATSDQEKKQQQTIKAKQRHSPRKEAREAVTKNKTSSRHSISPGEKTLSVLEIINSLDDEVMAVTTSRPATHTGGRPLGQTGISPLFNSQAIWPLRGSLHLGKFGEIMQSNSGRSTAGHGLHSRQVGDSLSGMSGAVKLGGTGRFGQGFYSASQVVSGMADPRSRHFDPHGPASADGLLAGTTTAATRRRFPQNGNSRSALSAGREKDENLDVFELKRFPAEKTTRPQEDDEDVIDLILSRHGYAVSAEDDDDDAVSVDLSAVCDDDADSNLDDIVREIEEEEERRADEDWEDFFSRKNRKMKSWRGNGSVDISDNEGHPNDLHDDMIDEDGLLAMIVKNMGDADDNSVVEDLNDQSYDHQKGENFSDDVDDIYDEAKLNEGGDLEESQILEDIFFVQ